MTTKIKDLPLLESNEECVTGQPYFIQETTGSAEGVRGFVENVEAGKNGRCAVFEGLFQHADLQNKNRRIYPEVVLKPEVDRLLPLAEGKYLYGELDHPDDAIVHLADASHLVRKLWWDGKRILGRAEILPTPAGKVLEACFSVGAKVGISSRGVGTGKMVSEGILEIAEGYRCITFDSVADPSTPEAYQAIAEAAGVGNPAAKLIESIVESLAQGDFERAQALSKNYVAEHAKSMTPVVDRVTIKPEKLSHATKLISSLLKASIAEKK